MPQAAVHGWTGIQHRITCFQWVTRRLNLGTGIAKGLDDMNVVICGNNVASPVAARKLLYQGHSVTIVSSSAAPGGFFKGYDLCGARVDIGMVLVELDSFNLDTSHSDRIQSAP